MNLKQVFINPVGRLRSGWRVLIFVMLFLLLTILLGIAAKVGSELATKLAPSRGVAHYVENLLSRVIILVAALGAGYICTRWLEGLPWRALGLCFHPKWFRDFVVGSVIGFASLAVATGIATVGGD